MCECVCVCVGVGWGGGYQNQTSASKVGRGSKFWSFYDNLIIECSPYATLCLSFFLLWTLNMGLFTVMVLFLLSRTGDLILSLKQILHLDLFFLKSTLNIAGC